MERFYRRQFRTDGLYAFEVKIAQSDLYFISDEDLRKPAEKAVARARRQVEDYIRNHPGFEEALSPLEPSDDAGSVVKAMCRTGEFYPVGPMASVAGAVAGYAGEELSSLCRHLIIENGGDIYIKSERPVILEVYTGEKSPFCGKLKFEANPRGKSLGICTSSGRIGHSLSFGKSDAVVAVADSPEIADAAATAIGNLITSADVIQEVLDVEIKRGILKALIIVMDDKMGAFGDIKFV